MGGHWVFSAKFLLGGAKEAQEHSRAPLRAETFLETAASTLQQLKFLGSLPSFFIVFWFRKVLRSSHNPKLMTVALN